MRLVIGLRINISNNLVIEKNISNNFRKIVCWTYSKVSTWKFKNCVL